MGIDDVSCYLFDKIRETGDTSLLNCQNHEQEWVNINDDFINTFGLSKEYQSYLNKMRAYIKYLNMAVNGGDRSKINIANSLKKDAESILNLNVGDDLMKYAIVSKYVGFRINPKEVTVKEFYNYLKLMQNGKEI